ncbi:MAG: AbrB/MazE/SpoVT family DNA-binding domain-containing protein [Candidatus Jacksonbacteria bacterium]
MNYTTTITQKGQVTLSKILREMLGVSLGDKIEIELLNKKQKAIKLKRLPGLNEIAGSFKISQPQDPVKIREYMQSHYQK